MRREWEREERGNKNKDPQSSEQWKRKKERKKERKEERKKERNKERWQARKKMIKRKMGRKTKEVYKSKKNQYTRLKLTKETKKEKINK